MKRLPRPLWQVWIDLRHCLRGLPPVLQKFWSPGLLFFYFLLIVISWVIFRHDAQLLRMVAPEGGPEPFLNFWARKLSFWGDYPTGSLPIAVTLWLAGYYRKNINWRRAAMACFLAASITGTISVATRCSLGRPRPCTGLPDGLYGPHISTDYQAFPSGHSATSWGTATALIITAPPVGIPLAFAAGGVVWSRLYLQRHNPSDVFVGTWIGILGGIACGLAVNYHASSRKKRALPKSGNNSP